MGPNAHIDLSFGRHGFIVFAHVQLKKAGRCRVSFAWPGSPTLAVGHCKDHHNRQGPSGFVCVYEVASNVAGTRTVPSCWTVQERKPRSRKARDDQHSRLMEVSVPRVGEVRGHPRQHRCIHIRIRKGPDKFHRPTLIVARLFVLQRQWSGEKNAVAVRTR